MFALKLRHRLKMYEQVEKLVNGETGEWRSRKGGIQGTGSEVSRSRKASHTQMRPNCLEEGWTFIHLGGRRVTGRISCSPSFP